MSIFAARTATRLAAVVADEDYDRADAAGREKRLDAAIDVAIRQAEDDLTRLGYVESRGGEDAKAFDDARTTIRGIKARVLEAIDQSPTPVDGSARRSRVYDVLLPEILTELKNASYARGISAAAARFEDNSPDAWTEYGQYQADLVERAARIGPLQQQPFGLQDMLGGMMEWTATPTMPYPYSMTLSEASTADVNRLVFDEAEIPMSRWATLEELPRFAGNPTLRDQTFYIVRGGSFERARSRAARRGIDMRSCRCAPRFTAHRESLGFRVVLEP